MSPIYLYLFILQLYCLFSVVLSASHSRRRKSRVGQGVTDVVDAVRGSLFSGFGTYYGVGFGSCGKKDTDDEMIVAVNQPQMHNGANPNTNPRCGKQVFIRGIHGSATARVEDTCPTCPSGNLDMSPTVFQKVCGDLDIGRCSIKWKFLS